MMAATTQKSKPNESQSFPDPSAMRDAVAALHHTHPLPHKLYNNHPLLLDLTPHMMTPCFSFFPIGHFKPLLPSLGGPFHWTALQMPTFGETGTLWVRA